MYLKRSIPKNLQSVFCRRRLSGAFSKPLILGIETSCDDTGAALVDGKGVIYSEEKSSQQAKHLMFGGIIPPVAQSLHRQNIEKIVTNAISKSGLDISDVDAIAVTNRPGLQLSLIVGVRYAKYLARKHNKPLIPIHHMEAHALTARISNEIPFPFLCLLLSGGHSLLAYVKNVTDFYLMGETLDDAPGEAFDKIARLLKLRNIHEYAWLSGGSAIEKAAKNSTCPDRYEFPLPLSRYRDCQFSFAGLKNNARRAILQDERNLDLSPDKVIPHYEDFCSGFLRASTRHILHRTQRAIEYCERREMFSSSNKKVLVVSGGVACNDFIFTALQQMAQQFNFEAIRPPKQQCTDNGIMIAWNGVERYFAQEGITKDYKSVDIYGKCALGTDIIEDVKKASIACKWVKTEIMSTKKQAINL